MAVCTITIPAMDNLVRSIEAAVSLMPSEKGAVSGKLSGVFLPTDSLSPVDAVVSSAQTDLVGLRRRLALARKIEASSPGIQNTVTIDESWISTKTPEQAAQDARRVAEALLEDYEDIPEEILALLEEGANDPYFAQALATAMPPGELAGFLRERDMMKVNYNASGMSDSEEALAWAAAQRRLQTALGQAYAVATTNSGDLALPTDWHQEWVDTVATTDFDGRGNASRLTLLMRQGVWSSEIIYSTYTALESYDWNGDDQYNTVTGPDYWLERVGSSSSYEGAMIPNEWGGYDRAYDPFESLMYALGNNPDAAVDLFAMPGADVATIEVGGEQHQINTYLYDMLFNREWHGDDFDAMAAAIEAAVMPRAGGSTDSQLVAADLQVVLDYAAEQERIREENDPPLWSKILHGVLDVLGFIPLVEYVADPLNAVFYLAEGDYANAGLSLAGMIPVIGYAAVGGRWVKVTRYLDEAQLDEMIAAGRAMPVDAGDVGRLADAGDLPQMARFIDDLDLPADTISLSSGATRSWNSELNRPLPNQTYLVDGRFVYRTDEFGRVTEASGHLDSLPGGARNTYQQRVSGRADRLPGDQGGHLFGTWFGGPGEAINILPMSSRVNLSEYKALEGTWAQHIADGSTIDVRVTPIYSGGSLRPDAFRVGWSLDGVTQRPLTIYN